MPLLAPAVVDVTSSTFLAMIACEATFELPGRTADESKREFPVAAAAAHVSALREVAVEALPGALVVLVAEK